MLFKKLVNILLFISLLFVTLARIQPITRADDGSLYLPPHVIDLYPFPGVEMSGQEPLFISFDQPMNAGSVESALSFSPALAGESAWLDGRTLSFTPLTTWGLNITYTLTIDTQAQSEQAIALEEPYNAEISSISSLLINDISPARDAQEVPLNAQIVVSFSRPMVPLTAVSTNTDLPHPLTITPTVEGTGEWVNTSLYIFTPSNGLHGGVTYEVEFDPALTSLDGAPLALPSPWEFTTIMPAVISIRPGQTENIVAFPPNIRLDTPITVYFNMPMDTASVEEAFSLYATTAYDEDGIFDNTLVAGTFSWNEEATQLMFTPNELLQRFPEDGGVSFNYVVVVEKTARSDYGQTPLADDYAVYFSTVKPAGIREVRSHYRDNQREDGLWEAGSYPEIIFNSPMNLDNIEDHIEIDPAPEEWELTYSYNGGIYLLYYSIPETTYTITLRAGLEDVYGDTIDEDYVFIYTTAEVQSFGRMILPDQYWAPFWVTSAYQQNTVIPFLVNGTPQYDFKLYKLESTQFYVNHYNYQSYTETPEYSQIIRHWTQTLGERNTIHQAIDIPLASLQGGQLEPGFYGLKVRSLNPPPSRYNNNGIHGIAVVNVHLTLQRSASEIMVWATDLKDGAPLANLPITVFHQDEVLLTGITDADGIFRADVDLYHDMDSPFQRDSQLIIMAQSEDYYGLWYTQGDPAQTTENFYLHTDRAIYRPGDTVYFRGIALQRQDNQFSVPTDAQIHISARAWGADFSMMNEDMTLNEFGTFSGSFVIPQDAQLGQVSLTMLYLVEYADFSYQYEEARSINFTVADYRANEYEITTTVEPEEIIQGEAVEANFQANYYSGEALANGEVWAWFFGCPYYFQYESAPEYQFVDETWTQFGTQYGRYSVYNLYASTRQNEHCSSFSSYPEYNPDIPSYFKIRTNALGSTEAEFQNTHFPNHAPMIVAIEGRINQQGHTHVAAQDYLIAHPSHIYVGAHTEHHMLGTDETTAVQFVAVTTHQDPVPNQNLELTIEQVTWEKTYKFNAYGRGYEWEEVFTPVSTHQLQTDANGEAHFEFSNEEAGTYRLRVVTFDAEGNRNSASQRIYVRDRYNQPSITSPQPTQLEILTDKNTYVPGETATVTVNFPYQFNGSVLLTVNRQQIMDYEVRQIEETFIEYQIPITAESVPNLYITVLAMRGPIPDDPYPSSLSASVDLSVEPIDRRLNIEVMPSTTEAEPGDTVEFQLRVTDADGQPIHAEISVQLTDEAILALLDANNPSLEAAFYSSYGTSVRPSGSLAYLIDRYTLELPNPYLGGGNGGGGPGSITPSPRIDFITTPLWEAHVITDEQGYASVMVDLPDNITRWRFIAQAITPDGKLGEEHITIVTTQPLVVRPATPRFFVAGDRLQLSATVANNTDTDQTITATIVGEGIQLEDTASQSVFVEAHTQQNVRWWVTVEDVDAVDLTFSAIDEQGHQDAVKPDLSPSDSHVIPVYRYIAPDVMATSGVLWSAGRDMEGISVPGRLLDEVDGGELVIQLDSSLADVILEGLDYLENYPHQCVEQTISRFLPNIVTYQALVELGIDNQELSDELLLTFTEAHIQLVAYQHEDGGWGWFYNTPHSNVQTTTYAVLGLIVAQEAGLDVNEMMLENALSFLNSQQNNFESSALRLNQQAFIAYVLARAGQANLLKLNQLYDQRSILSIEAKSYLLMAYDLTDRESLAVPILIDEIKNKAIYTATGIHWEDTANSLSWTTNTRTTALALSALIRFEPESDLLPMVVRWLLVVRQRTHWGSSQETAWSLMAFTDWLVATSELQGNYDYHLQLNGDTQLEGTVTPDNALTEKIHVLAETMDFDELNYLAIERSQGNGVLYYMLYLTLNLKASEVDAVNHGVSVAREYTRIDAVEEDSTTVHTGDLINVEVRFTLSHAIDYFVLEDPIPSGSEIVDTQLNTSSLLAEGQQIQSGDYSNWGWWWIDRAELRADGTYLYADFLPAGVYTYTYQIQATIPGEFQVLPTHAYALYMPDIWGRSRGLELIIEE